MHKSHQLCRSATTLKLQGNTNPGLMRYSVAYLELNLDDLIIDCVLSSRSDVADGSAGARGQHYLAGVQHTVQMN